MPDPTNPPTAVSAAAQTQLPSAPLDTEATRVMADPPRAPGTAPEVRGYALVRELARGGMGAVYLARDPAFGRDVAVKVMHPGQDAGRFVVESKVTAQLPHPGVPPVYALGELPDGRPYLAMKLIEGRTLADELKVAAADLPRLLDAFQHIAQTVGFAHARGIVHRDLKPSNVMVGRFGEVLVLDWGLAKRATGSDDPSGAGFEGLGAPAGDATVAGQVKGTPAYMAPEQARGEAVDARADVFALGGILAAILTGRPPFAGNSVMDTILRSAQAELGPCFDDLGACGADAELVAVAKRCLAARPDDRPSDGSAVAAAVADYRAGLDQRLRAAERDRAAAEVRAVEQRRQKRLQMLGICVMAVVMTVVTGVQQWYERREERQKADADRAAALADARLDAERRVKAEQARGGVTAALALAADLRAQFKFAPARAAVAQAAELARGAPDLAPAVEAARRDLDLAIRLDDIRYRKWRWVPTGGGKGGARPEASAGQYREAFRAAGLDLAALDPREAAKRVSASGVKAELVAALDDWALWEADAALRDRLLAVAAQADPGGWTDRLRDPAVRGDKAAVAKLASSADLEKAVPATLCVLAELMRRHGLSADALLTAARAKHPTDFELSFTQAQGRLRLRKDGSALGAYESARSLRPDNVTVWNNLGGLLHALGDAPGAAAAYREAVRLDPTFPLTHHGLGNALRDSGDDAGAAAAYAEAVRLDDKLAFAHKALAELHLKANRVAAATASARAAVAADGEHAGGHAVLAECLERSGDAAGAAAARREAERLAK